MKTKIYKVLSIMLTLAVILSTCLCAIGTVSAEDATYYVATTGDDTAAGTEQAPFQTLKGALKKALADAKAGGYNSPENTVYIKLLEPYVATDERLVDGSGCNDIDYDFTLNISAATEKACLDFAKASANTVYLNGPTVFENLYLNIGSSSKYTELYLYGNNTVFNNTEFWRNANKPDLFNTAGCAGKTTVTYDEAQTVVYNTTNNKDWYGYIIGGCQGTIYNDNFTLSYNAPNYQQEMTLGATTSGGFGVTFNKAFNLDIKGTAGITFKETQNGVTFGENAVFQLINSSGKTVVTTAIDAKLANIPNYIITDAQKVIEFTDTVGKYAVNLNTDLYEVKATAEGKDDVVAEDGFLTLTEGKWTVTATKKSNAVGTYYVSATGDDAAAGTKTAPKATLNAAINAAIAGGYAAGDTVYVKTIGADAVQTGLASKGQFADYAFKLVVTADDITVPGTISGVHRIGGETEYTHVKVSGEFSFAHNNAVFGEGASLSSNNSTSIAQNSQSPYTLTTTAPVNIKLSTYASFAFYFCGLYYDNAVYNHPLTLEIDNYSPYYKDVVYGGFYLSTGNCSATYNAPVNIKVNEATNVLVFKSTDTKTTYGENFAFQLINSSNKAVAKTGDTLTRQDSATGICDSALDDIDAGKKYILTNNSGIDDIVTFTDTVGKFKVFDDRYIVTATPATGDPIKSVDGVLTVPAGEYTLTASKMAETLTYYVASTADGGASDNDGKSADKPLASVGEALEKANDYGVLSADTIVIKVVGTTANAVWGEDVKCNAGVIKVESNDLNNISTIVPPAAAVSTVMGGLTEYDNIIIKGIPSTHNPDRIISNARSVTFGENVVVLGSSALYPAFQATTVNETLTYTIKNAYSGQLYLTHWNNNGITYKGDLNYIVENANAVANFKVASAYNSASANKINGNLNIAIYDAASFAFENKGTKGNSYYTIAGAAQIITPSKLNADISNIATIGQNDTAPAGGVYHLINDTDIPHIVEFTDTVGKYAVDTETYIVKATDKDGNETFAEEGSLYLENPGEYVITAEPRPATTLEYFVELGSTAENTYPTVAAAIDAAKLAGLTKIDHLVVKVKGNATIGAIAEYPFTLIVESAEETATLNVQNYMLARGRTIYRNINLDAETLNLNGGAVTLEKDVSFNGLCIAIANSKAIINAKLALVEIIGEGSFDVTVNNPESEFIVNFGTVDFTDVRLNVKSAEKVEFTGTPNVSGKVEIAVNKNTTVVGKAVIDAISAEKWYIVNQTGDADALDFTDTIGTYTYVSGREVALTNGSNEYIPVNAVITAPAGEYNFVIKTQAEAKYADYIKNRGTGLKNSFSKLSKGEEVNVLYFGGSVTNGTGASSENVTSWRGLIGSWLVNTFPAAKVNNINVAYGGTSTMFGSYRLKEEVLSQAPDLIFVEFSINDHYDNTSGSKLYPVTKALAAKRFETIVRQIREAYPECDIVTVLTTEKAYINTNRNGNLHEQAQGHEEISIAYDIPSIHIGRALSDHLSPNYADDNYAEWYEYVTDIVHPNDKGYEVYYNVIKEYLADELIYGDYDGSKSAHTVPELQSDVLMDGDVMYVDATEALVTESGTLGGSGFEFTTSGGMPGNFAGGAKATAGNDSKFVIKFTGTELALLSNNCKAKEFTVTVDGGTPATVKKTGIYPEVLATGLNYGEHTVEIVPVFDSDTTFTIIGFFTRNETLATHKHTYSNYVSNNDATCQKNETETALCDYGCGEEDTRDIPESKADHSFTDYTSDNNAECGKNCTETAYCDYDCGEHDTREIEGTALEHEFDGPSDIDCNHGCGYTRPLGKMLVTEGGEKYYYNNGVKQTEVTDLVWIDGVWYYIEEGRWASDIDTLHKINGKWFLVKGGIWNKTTGLEEYKGKTFYVSGGKWDSSVTDLKKVDGVWYYIQYGKWNNTIDTLHKINGKWFLIKKGIWNKTTGLVEYKGKTFYVSGGKWNSSVNTLYKKGSKYYAIKSGKLYEGKTIITYSGKKFYCNKGYAQLSFSGKVKIGSKTYTIKAGKVV